ncbi:hypothetical protein ACFSR7_06060 [Cohnella sp. GCM10020058]|uniref:hypothetical protein n=1 Tax=Cohnella sp. GCM10020058 TaxID=3317330 RepID=UPI00363795A5
MKTAAEAQEELRSQYDRLIGIFAESIDAVLDEELPVNEFPDLITKLAREGKKLEFPLTQHNVMAWMVEHCFKQGIFKMKQVRHQDVDLKPFLQHEVINGKPFFTNWPFPDGEKYIVEIFSRSKQYQGLKDKLHAAGYEVEEESTALNIRLKIGIPGNPFSHE